MALDYTLTSCYNKTTGTYSLPCLNGGVSPSSSCQQACQMYSNSSPTISTANGIRTVSQTAIKVTCGSDPSSSSNVSCVRTTTATYTCISGYYGTATSSSSGCNACPDNATCPGGNGSTFTCNAKFAKCGGSSCCSCIAGNYCPGDNIAHSCSTDTGHSYATSAASSDAITDCYVPTTYNWSFSNDGIGSGTQKFTSNCYYSN